MEAEWLLPSRKILLSRMNVNYTITRYLFQVIWRIFPPRIILPRNLYMCWTVLRLYCWSISLPVSCTSQWGTPINCFELNSLPHLFEQHTLLLRDAARHNWSVLPSWLLNEPSVSTSNKGIAWDLLHLVCLFKCHVYCIFLLRSVSQIHYGTWNMSTLFYVVFA